MVGNKFSTLHNKVNTQADKSMVTTELGKKASTADLTALETKVGELEEKVVYNVEGEGGRGFANNEYINPLWINWYSNKA